MDTTCMFVQFKKEQQQNQVLKEKAWKIARDRKDRLIEASQQTGQLKRASIKLLMSSRLEKKLLYSLNSKAAYAEIQRIKNDYQQERKTIFARYGRKQWADWLRSQATSGNAEALAALRDRKSVV